MKNSTSSAMRCNGRSFASTFKGNYGVWFITTALLIVLMTSCKKEAVDAPEQEIQSLSSQAAVTGGDILSQYTGLDPITMWELQQARAASSRYLDFENAKRDGYADINVVTPQMGYHYLKALNLDINFDYRKPEILIYNKRDDGSMQLVAVEYAVPIPLTPNTAPEGFYGTNDVWDKNAFFNLWLLHTWVWSFNPNGVFNPTNPSIHVH